MRCSLIWLVFLMAGFRLASRCSISKSKLVLCLLASALLSTPARTQTQLGTVLGIITDATGAVLPGVTVTLFSLDTGLKRDCTTDTEAKYRLAGLPIGTYRVRMEKEGFPLVHDRTFFFANYEGFREVEASTAIATVPDALAHQGLLPSSGNPRVCSSATPNGSVLPQPLFLYSMTYHPKFPYALQYNLNVEREITLNTALTAGCFGAPGNHLGRGAEQNPFQPQLGRRFNPTLPSSLLTTLTNAQSFYNSFELGISQRYSHHLSWRASYTFSHSIDDASTSDALEAVNELPAIQDLFNRKGSRGRSEFDIRHNFVLNSTYELPSGHTRGLGGWQISGIGSFHSNARGGSGPSRNVLQAHVNPAKINVPIVDGNDKKFVRVSTADGVAQAKVDQIAQDDQGFIWFGTRYGLYRYDGYNFKVFVRDPRNPNSLDSVVVEALFKDRDGALWVGGDEFLDKFDLTRETFARYPIPFVTHISQDTAGMLWLATLSGLYGLDPATGKTRHYSHDPSDASSLSSNDVTYSGEDREGRLWVATGGYLEEFDRRAKKVTRHLQVPDAPLGFRFYEDRFGVFWIFHVSPNPLAVFDRKTNTLTNYAFPKREPNVTRVTAMVEDRSGALWIATHGLGLLKFDREHGRFIRYHNDPGDLDSLSQDKVDALFADREGSIWVAPGRMGPAHFGTKPRPFEKLPRAPGSTIEPFVGALYEDRQGILWIGTPEALNRLDRKTGRVTSYRIGGPEIGSDVVAIREDRSGNLWVGTYGHGLRRFDRRTGRFKTYGHNPADPHSLSNDIVMSLLIDHNGALWVGTYDGLNRFDDVRERFTVYKPAPEKNLIYLDLVEDQNGALWIGTLHSGLCRFDPVTGQLTVYEHNRNHSGTLSDNRVNSVHFDRSGTMWVGTQNGLNKLEPKGSSFAMFTQRDGLPGNAVGCVLEDDHDNLWMSTNNGVARFNSKRKMFTNFSTADGLPGPNLTGWGACSQSPDGAMFFGGFNGGTSFFPEKVVAASYVPPIVLTDFRVAGNAVEIGSHSPLQESISFTKDLVLSHNQNIFSLTFAALSYVSPATNRYRYKLEGLERDWNEVSSDRRQATYTTLPAGKYTLRVQGATSQGPWTEPGIALPIEILSPWWSTLWFKTTFSTFLLLVVLAAYGYRLQQLTRQFDIRTEARVSERIRIARELHDTLLQNLHGLMFQFQAARNMFHKRPEEAIQTLDTAIAGTEQAITESQNAIEDLRSEPIPQKDLAELVRAVGNELWSSQNGEGTSPVFDVIVEGERRTLLPLVQNEVYRIAREVLRNAFRHARAHRIEAEIRYDPREFRLRIRDDGKGIAPKVLEAGKQAGHWGLPGVRERAQRIGAKLDLWSEAGAGTEIQLTLPAALAYETSRDRSGFRLFRRARNHEHRS